MEIKKLEQLESDTCFVKLVSATGSVRYETMSLEAAFNEKAKHSEGMTQIVEVQIWHRLV